MTELVKVRDSLKTQLSSFTPTYVLVQATGTEGKDFVSEALASYVYYCLPRAVARDEAKDVNGLRRELLAVKIANDSLARETLLKEVSSLLKIKQYKESSDTSRKFLTLKDYAKSTKVQNKDGISWIVMDASHPSLTLTDLLLELKQVRPGYDSPDSFVAHLFLELFSIVKFLHTDCSLAYGDINSSNTLFRLDSTRDRSKYPEVIAIDFERAVLGDGTEKDKALMMDTTSFLATVSNTIKVEFQPKSLTEYEEPDELRSKWKDFKNFACQIKSKGLAAQKENTLERMQKEYVPLATEVLSRATAEEIKTFNDEVDRVVREKGKHVTDEQLTNAAKMARSNRDGHIIV